MEKSTSQDIFKPASEIFDSALKSANLDRPCPALSSVAQLVHITNRFCSASRPRDPKGLLFTISESHSTRFITCWCSETRTTSLIFYSADCLHLFSVAKSWYIDGTFAVVGKSFKQLLSIYCFVIADTCVKQVLLVFCLMSTLKTLTTLLFLKQ